MAYFKLPITLPQTICFPFLSEEKASGAMSVEDLWVIYALAYDTGTIIFSLQAFLGRHLSPEDYMKFC